MIENKDFENWKYKAIRNIKAVMSTTDGKLPESILDVCFDNAYLQGGNETLKKVIESQSQ